MSILAEDQLVPRSPQNLFEGLEFSRRENLNG
jgi:hypothetical protein